MQSECCSDSILLMPVWTTVVNSCCSGHHQPVVRNPTERNENLCCRGARRRRRAQKANLCVVSMSYIAVFTTLHVMQTRSSDENSVCPSVCHTRELWQNGRKICPDLYTIRKIIYPSFLRRRMVGVGRPLLPEILGQPAPVGAKSPILNR